MLAWAGMRAARADRGAYAKLPGGGLPAPLLCQAALNVFAVLGLAPLTGVPLPFISYGPSNLIVLLAAMGLLLNIAAGGSAPLRVLRGGRRSTSRAGGSSSSGSASASRARRAGTGRP